MKDNDSKVLVEANISAVYEQVREVLTQARTRALHAFNTEMVAAYWNVGRLIVNEEQRGNVRAKHGRGLIKELSVHLATDFGKGYDRSNLWCIQFFFLAYPKVDALRRELTFQMHSKLDIRNSTFRNGG